MDKNISLILSGGGARGIAHIGVIKYLEQNGYVIKEIGGTSMGSIVGAIYSSGKLNQFENFLKQLDAKRIIKLLDFSITRPGLITGKKIIEKIGEFLSEQNVENLKIPYFCIATDINSGKEIIWKKGNLKNAIHSSFAIPFVFTPVYVEEKILVDGGVVNNIPVNHVSRNYPVVAVCVNSSIKKDNKIEEILNTKTNNITIDKIEKYIQKFIPKKEKNKMSYYKVLDEALHLLIEKNSLTNISNFNPDILINMPRDIAGTFDFLKAEKLIEIGYYLAESTFNNTKYS